MRGQRLPDGHHSDAQPGDYWRQPHSHAGMDGERGTDWNWYCCTPLGVHHALNQHEVTEYSDGIITLHGPVPNIRPVEHLGWELVEGNWIDLGGDLDKSLVPNLMPPATIEERRLWLPRH